MHSTMRVQTQNNKNQEIITFFKKAKLQSAICKNQNQNRNQNYFYCQVYLHIQEIALVWLVNKVNKRA